MTSPLTAQQQQELEQAPVYWTARAMQAQGSRFYRALGEALNAADATNRRLILRTWPAACWDFYERGRRLAADGEG
ncbi:hypothetical protein [Deinococcus arcticus]|uniref:Uncharacterized protein n=1 Tax=Deinococcus arcticus TaxID=2136176 RepID=A0A2T3WCV0_9DEIO|nr:hypothetical protein [Deinococcus arcticus]PTA69729.1 hypothetical protein C8263_01565 [Deinococcus arcticus]